jgi:hypothetical protein
MGSAMNVIHRAHNATERYEYETISKHLVSGQYVRNLIRG